MASIFGSDSTSTEPCDERISSTENENAASSDITDFSEEGEGDKREDNDNPFFGGDDGNVNVATIQKRPSYMNLGGSTGLLPSTHPFEMGVVKRLDSFFDDTMSEILEEEKLKTFLRIRPTAAAGSGSEAEGVKTRSFKKQKKVLEVKDDTTVVAYPTQKSHTSFLKNGGDGTKQVEFKFSKVLGPDCGQSTVFEECINPLIDKFLKNENCLIFTYGATNSGKTYTLQGHGVEYGIIPRSLDAIFSRIQDRLFKNGEIQPHLYQGFRHLSPKEIEICEMKKGRILAEAALIKKDLSDMKMNQSHHGSQSSSRSGSTVNLVGGHFDEMNYALFANTTMFSVWVSYTELYNERVYDLLETVYIGKNKRRKELKLMQDRNGCVYVRDLTEIHVTSDDEAYKIFIAGRKHLQFASTQMNQKSSRSHSFFTLRVITIGIGEGLMPYPKSVHRLTFCDLAGMERVHQTENEGVRLKESGNINASLTVLLKVIRLLRERQVHRNNMVETIPFRESKLTHIFKSFLTSSTHICMIVNVNPDLAMANSTLQVLHNSAIASNVIVFRPLTRKPFSNRKRKPEQGQKEAAKKEKEQQDKKQVEFAMKKTTLLFDSSTPSPHSSSISDSDNDEVPTVIARNRLLHDRVAILERENQELRIRLAQVELEKEQIREGSIKLITEQNRLWSKRFQEARLVEENLNLRRISLVRTQLTFSPGSKCGRNYTPPTVDMEKILEELEEEKEDEDGNQGEIDSLSEIVCEGEEVCNADADACS